VRVMVSAYDWFYWALLAAVFAAFTAIFAKLGLAGIDADFATLVRTWVILVTLTGFVLLARKWRNPLTLPSKTGLFLVLSGLTTGASWVCYFRALQIGEASKVAAMDKLSLLLAAVFATLFLHERPTPREWLAILFVGVGVVILGFKR
jgi:bacterial/archaeal transporter family protein